MTAKFPVGQHVWVPSSRLTGSQPFALVQRTVLGQLERSVIVDDRNGTTVNISSRLVHPATLGFLVLRIGDMETEPTLLNPLAKSVLQYLRLLVSDDAIRSLHVRTPAEIEQFMQKDGALYSHLIVVGHGTGPGLSLMGGETLPVAKFAQIIALGGSAKTIVSLACSTGQDTFGRTLSSHPSCKEFVAPYREAHGASASLFTQLLLHSHLLHGHEFHTAARRADQATEGTRFRHWRNGNML